MPDPTIEDLGSLGPFIKDGEWTDTIQWKVAGYANKYAAMVALNNANRGWNSAHPEIPGIVGKAVGPADPDGGVEDGDAAWIFNVEYAKPDGKSGDGELDKPVTEKSPLIQVKFGLISEPCDIDYAGNLVVNSAGDPFDPPQTSDQIVILVSELKYLESYSANIAAAYYNKINLAPIELLPHGSGDGIFCAAKTVRCNNYAPPNPYYAFASPIPVLFEFEYRPNGFSRQLLDWGFRAWYSTAGGNKLGKIVVKGNGGMNPPAKPILLDGTGKPLNPDGLTIADTAFTGFVSNPSTVKPPTYAAPVALSNGGFKLPYRFHNTADFSHFVSLGL